MTSPLSREASAFITGKKEGMMGIVQGLANGRKAKCPSGVPQEALLSPWH